MIAWGNIAALAGLLLVAGPVLVHLLLRHRATRVLFPSLRFVRTSRTAAVRFRVPSDLALLLLRMAIVSAAVVALARPLLLTRARISAWNTRVAKAVVVDVSESMKAVSAAAAEAARGESQGAFFARQLEAGDLEAGVKRAVAALQQAPPAPREIVIVSDFQWGALARRALEAVPAGTGLRFTQVSDPPVSRRVRGPDLFTASRSVHQDFTLYSSATRIGEIVTEEPGDGLTILAAPADAAAVEALRRVVAAAGALAPSPTQSLTLAFANARVPSGVRPIERGWMVGAVLRLKGDLEVAEACVTADAVTTSSPESPWRVLFRDRKGRTIVRAAAAQNALLIDVASAPSAFVSAAVMRAALNARHGPLEQPEEEVRRMPPEQLAALQRPAAPVRADLVRPDDGSDSRWCWALVLLLLGIEMLVRREHQGLRQERDDAA